MAARRLVVVGGGRMGEALVRGLRNAGWPAGDLGVAERSPDRRRQLAEVLVGVAVEGEVEAAAGHVVAVKPDDVGQACRALAAAGATRVLSVAAGVTLARIEAELPTAAVVRAMPNTPALVGCGAAAVAGGRRAGEEDLVWAEEVLGAVGRVVRVGEADLDAVTGLSGSGPAYVFLVAEALVEAGVHAGLPRTVSRELVLQTILGAARMLTETGEDASALRAAVTSPGGTTAAGLAVLEAAAVRSAFLAAVEAAAGRSRALGG